MAAAGPRGPYHFRKACPELKQSLSIQHSNPYNRKEPLAADWIYQSTDMSIQVSVAEGKLQGEYPLSHAW